MSAARHRSSRGRSTSSLGTLWTRGSAHFLTVTVAQLTVLLRQWRRASARAQSPWSLCVKVSAHSISPGFTTLDPASQSRRAGLKLRTDLLHCRPSAGRVTMHHVQFGYWMVLARPMVYLR